MAEDENSPTLREQHFTKICIRQDSGGGIGNRRRARSFLQTLVGVVMQPDVPKRYHILMVCGRLALSNSANTSTKYSLLILHHSLVSPIPDTKCRLRTENFISVQAFTAIFSRHTKRQKYGDIRAGNHTFTVGRKMNRKTCVKTTVTKYFLLSTFQGNFPLRNRLTNFCQNTYYFVQ